MRLKLGIIGNGPSALFLSFILHGNIPYYDPSSEYGPHPDEQLHNMLMDYREDKNLLEAMNNKELLEYIETSYTSFFSSDMLPINILFDTLISSDEIGFANKKYKQTRIKWVKSTTAAIPHIILGSSMSPGGQWSSAHPETDDPHVKALSYAEMLSLPGYSFSGFFESKNNKELEEYYRPARTEMSDYLLEYSKQTGIINSIISNSVVTSVTKNKEDTFDIYYTHNNDKNFEINTENIILATGIFESPLASSTFSWKTLFNDFENNKTHEFWKYNTPNCSYTLTPPLATPPPESQLCTSTKNETKIRTSVLVIGSGVSAAEAIYIDSNNQCPVTHIYKWDSTSKIPSPLKRFPRELYPEYAQVYDLMRNKIDTDKYEGLANAKVISVSPAGETIIQLQDGSKITKHFNQIKIRTGRSGSLSFCYNNKNSSSITSKTFRNQVQGSTPNLCVDKNMYIIGSLTGDTLVRFLLGGCAWVANEFVN